MADQALTALPAASALSGTDLLYGVQSATSVKITATQLQTFIGTGAITSGANTFTALQTITQGSANAGILASTGYSLTDANAQNMVDLAGTWNTSGNPTAIKLNVTATAYGATSKLLDIQHSTVSVLSVFPNTTTRGSIRMTNGVDTMEIGPANQYYSLISVNNTLSIRSVGNSPVTIDGPPTGVVPVGGAADGLSISRRGLFFGRHAALITYLPTTQAPVGMTIEAQVNDDKALDMVITGGASDPAGTTEILGGAITITAGAGASGSSGKASGGNIVLAGGAGYGTGFQGSVAIGTAAIATTATSGFLYIPTCAGTPAGTPDTLTGRFPMVYDSTNHKLYIYDGGWKGGTVPGVWS